MARNAVDAGSSPTHSDSGCSIASTEPDFAAQVDLTIEQVPEGRRVQLVQQGFPSEERRDEFAAAWPDVLEELARRVSVA